MESRSFTVIGGRLFALHSARYLRILFVGLFSCTYSGDEKILLTTSRSFAWLFGISISKITCLL